MSAGIAPDPVLRDYQQIAVDELRAAFRAGHRRVLLVSPTGSGKTVEFSYIVASAVSCARRVAIIVHRDELIDQTGRALAAVGVEHGVIAAGHPENDAAPAQIASIATLARRLDRYRGSFDLVVLDEAHHAAAMTWRAALEAFPTAWVLGATATPERLDGAPLGNLFEMMVVGPDVAELTRLGYLAPAIVYAPEREPDLRGVAMRGGDFDAAALERTMLTGTLVGDAVEQYVRLAAGQPAIVFAVSRRHSEALADRFATAGFRAAHVDGETPPGRRRELIAALAEGGLDVLTNCNLIAEGFDAPAVAAVVIARPTRSLALYLQMYGRALRPSPGKEGARILDHGGNVYRYGLPDAPRAWSLDKRRVVDTKPPPVRRCACCGAIARAAARRPCPGCGRAFPARPRELREVPGHLVAFAGDRMLDRLRTMSYGQVLRWAGADAEKLALVAMARGYKLGWTFHRLNEQRERAA